MQIRLNWMVFTNAINIDPCITIVNSYCIERVSEYKYLGIWIDQIFSFKYHIYNLVCKLCQKVGLLYRNKSWFHISCRKIIVEATILTVLDYGDVIYRHAASWTLKPLDSIYHSALTFITDASYNTHHCLLYDMTYDMILAIFWDEAKCSLVGVHLSDTS